MILQNLSLQNFRNHTKRNFEFTSTTIIIGKNTAGKTNILEAIHFLSTGKSFKAEKEIDTISQEKDFGKILATIQKDDDKTLLEITLAVKNNYFSKKFKVNNVPRRQIDFASHFYSVLFTPQDIEIISSSPSIRRKYLDMILIQSSKEYRRALSLYEKSLRHRNRMLHDMKDGKKNYRTSDFEYWDSLLIENGAVITQTRNTFIEFVNDSKKEIFDFQMYYDKSTITQERLEKYYYEERAAGVTLVGPQRDDFVFYFANPSPRSSPLKGEENQGRKKTIREFGSRGQQRLTLLQMKVFEVSYLQQSTAVIPTLLLDDIFSELDAGNIEKVFALIPTQQTIITTTHEEFVPTTIAKNSEVQKIEL